MATHFARLLKARKKRGQGPRSLPIGITEAGIVGSAADPPLDLVAKFRMVKQAGVFDYIEATPAPEEVDTYRRLSEKFGIPIGAGGGRYVVGRDEERLKRDLEIGASLGYEVHTIAIAINDADGERITDRDVMELYLRAYEIGADFGCKPSLGVHVGTWAEDFRRVSRLGTRIKQRNSPFRVTLDPGDVVFKVDNPREHGVFDIGAQVDAGRLVLDPSRPGNVCEDWIARGYVRHCHARPAVPNNPTTPGSRGAQYPFIRPAPGAFDADWSEARLAPWKETMRYLMTYHATHEDSRLGCISTAFSPTADHLGDGKYALFENAVACASWLREVWLQSLANEAAKLR